MVIIGISFGFVVVTMQFQIMHSDRLFPAATTRNSQDGINAEIVRNKTAFFGKMHGQCAEKISKYPTREVTHAFKSRIVTLF